MNKFLRIVPAAAATFALLAAPVIKADDSPSWRGRLDETPMHADAPAARDLPPDAQPGQCYARVIIPAEYRTVTEQVTRREASEKITIVPARYETQTEQVMVRPATTHLVEVPAEYQMQDETIEVAPSHSEWHRGKCNPKATLANATGECWCMVDVPAVTKTVSKRVMTKPASTREIEEPAQYQTVSKKVLVEPSHEDRSPIPAETENVSRKELVTPSRVDWVHIDCQAKEPAEPAPKVKRMREPGINGWYTFQSR